MENVDSQRLLHSFYNGATELIDKKEELNRINVFPVADGDTGSNLASLMQAILDNVSASASSTEMVLAEVAEASLMGARGNSGIIFAQYLSGLATAFQQSDGSDRSLVLAFKNAVAEAYQAVQHPQEGTILTVMQAWAESLAFHFAKINNLVQSLQLAQAEAFEALTQTEFQMSVLKKNRLVDSGAKGFCYFIAGFTQTYCSAGEVKRQPVAKVVPEHFSSSESIEGREELVEAPTQRYCTEFLMKDLVVPKAEIAEFLARQGDSLILAGNQSQLKIHLHCNQPEQVLQTLENYGRVVQQKVDDMLLQFNVTQQRKYPIAIVTDSIGDLPADFLLREQIHVLPANILGEELSYLDKLTINSQLVKEKLARQIKLTTAQPSIKTVDSLLSFLDDKYEHVLIISVAAQLSGTYQLIHQRLKTLNYNENKFHVIDSKLNSVAQGLLVRAAVEEVQKGTSFKELISKITATIPKSFIYVAVADITPMIRSGRIPVVLGKIAQKLRVLPIVTLDSDGNGKLVGFGFSQAQSLKKIRKWVNQEIQDKNIAALGITHVGNQQEAERLAQGLVGKNSELMKYIVESSTAIAISAGFGSVAIAGIKKEGQR